MSTPEVFTIVLSIVNSCFSNAELPTMFHVGCISAIYKNQGDVGLFESYRPISLLQTLYKLFTKLLELRLRLALEEALSKWQYGFRKKLSVDNAIFDVLRLIELSENFSGFPVYLLLLD